MFFIFCLPRNIDFSMGIEILVESLPELTIIVFCTMHSFFVIFFTVLLYIVYTNR